MSPDLRRGLAGQTRKTNDKRKGASFSKKTAIINFTVPWQVGCAAGGEREIRSDLVQSSLLLLGTETTQAHIDGLDIENDEFWPPFCVICSSKASFLCILALKILFMSSSMQKFNSSMHITLQKHTKTSKDSNVDTLLSAFDVHGLILPGILQTSMWKPVSQTSGTNRRRSVS